MQGALWLQHRPPRPRHLPRRRSCHRLRMRQSSAARSHRQTPLWHQVPDPADTRGKHIWDLPLGQIPKSCPGKGAGKGKWDGKRDPEGAAGTHCKWGLLPGAPRRAGRVPRGSAVPPAWHSSRHGAGSTCSEKRAWPHPNHGTSGFGPT